MKRILVPSAVAMSALLGIGMAVTTVNADPGSERATGVAERTKDVVATVAESGHFKTFMKAVEAADLADMLAGAGAFTVFVPSDEAFAKLPSGTLDELLKPENKDRLKAVLLTHVVPGHILIAEIKRMNHARTSGGTTLRMTHHLLTGVHIGTAKDMAHVQNSDIDASNGVIHVIDKVIVP